MSKILMVTNKTGSVFYRIYPVAKALREKGHEVVVKEWNSMIFGYETQWADLVTTEMVYAPQVIKMINDSDAHVIYEMDDFMHKVAPNHPAYKDMDLKRKIFTHLAVAKADHITVTTQTLKDAYKWANPNITVLPNYLDMEHWVYPYRKNASDTLRIGWAGSVMHRDDLHFIEPIVKRVLDRQKKTKFLYVGDGGWGYDETTKYNYGKDYFSSIPLERRTYLIGVTPEFWPKKLSTLQFDIGLAPIRDQIIFNRSKSTCKYLEYAINRIPGVYQRWHYGQTVKDGVTGLLADTPEEWEEAINKLVENPDLRAKIAENAYNDVRQNHDFATYKHLWTNLYEEQLAKPISHGWRHWLLPSFTVDPRSKTQKLLDQVKKR